MLWTSEETIEFFFPLMVILHWTIYLWRERQGGSFQKCLESMLSGQNQPYKN